MGKLSSVFRDFDLYLLKEVGEMTELQVKAEALRRDMKDVRKEPFYISTFVFLLIILGYEMRIQIWVLLSLAVYSILKGVFSTWIKLAEMKTEITYLEAGLTLIRE